MPSDGDKKPAAVEGAKKSAANSSTKESTKKKGKFRRIKGLLTGESRRERRARKEAERAAAGITEPLPADDDESVYGIDLDSMSVSGSMAAASSVRGGSMLGSAKSGTEKELAFLSPSAKAPPLQVILLLMDPNTRRFELLQLEFDSHKALVSDVLAQIPLSVTEEQLRRQHYEGVCDRAGLEMIKTMRLSEFCKTNEVILAIPNGMSSKECARLARPILSDEGVISMLRASGINTEAVAVDPNEDRDITLTSDEVSMKSEWSSVTQLFILFMAVLAIVVGSFQIYITTPLQPGQTMSPGMWMSKCGILSAFPLLCEKNSGLEMNDQGVLTLYGYDGSVQWRITGGHCRPNTDCFSGLVIKDDGNLVIGGKSITSVTIKGDAPLSPWPFVREPKLRVVRR